MTTTAADCMVESLLEWGVDIVFGLPGDGINGIIEALRQRQDRIRFLQVRHEETAAFMACGYAKLTGRLGVCLATSGPGGIHLLNGLYDAKLDGAPCSPLPACNITTSWPPTRSRMWSSTSCSWMSASTTRASWERRMSRMSSSLPAALP